MILQPLKGEDFEALFKVASDPLVWEQHPNRDRYKREVFEVFFRGAMESNGAFLIRDAKTNEVIGSSRYYPCDQDKEAISIGYTFFARKCWGKGINPSVKKLMLDHAFKFYQKAIFHVGANNIRSQKAMEKIGGIKIGEEELSYYGEPEKLNFVYEILNPKPAIL